MSTTTSTILRGRTVTRGAVLRAISEFRTNGIPDTLRLTGYGPSRRWVVRHDGRSYPSKAVLGLAAGLRADDFFGGIAETTRVLRSLGFEVRRVCDQVDSTDLVPLRDRLVQQGLDVVEQPWTAEPAPAAYYPSGSNRPAEIRGLAAAGSDIGVTVSELSEQAIVELERLGGTDVSVFIDSGAFSEVHWNAATLAFDAVRPISNERWVEILAVYRRLSRALGAQLSVVAPDRVGCQATTLTRIYRHRDALAELQANGTRVLVALQKGAESQWSFARRVDAILGNEDWVPALPCKKAATTPAEVRDFVLTRKPRHVHLLGVGVRSRNLEAYAAAFPANGGTSYSLDSCWIAANAGRATYVRRYTAARDAAKALLATVASTVAFAELAIYTCFA